MSASGSPGAPPASRTPPSRDLLSTRKNTALLRTGGVYEEGGGRTPDDASAVLSVASVGGTRGRKGSRERRDENVNARARAPERDTGGDAVEGRGVSSVLGMLAAGGGRGGSCPRSRPEIARASAVERKTASCLRASASAPASTGRGSRSSAVAPMPVDGYPYPGSEAEGCEPAIQRWKREGGLGGGRSLARCVDGFASPAVREC